MRLHIKIESSVPKNELYGVELPFPMRCKVCDSVLIGTHLNIKGARICAPCARQVHYFCSKHPELGAL